jgi:hypothetical protein
MVERAIASSAWRLTSSVARSSRLPGLATQSCALVLLVASVTTSSCSSGGKAPGPTGAWSILQTSQTVLEKACVPQSDGVASATELVGNLQIGWLILGCEPSADPAAKDQRLRRGVGSEESLQAILGIEVQYKRRRKRVGHDRHPCHVTEAICQLDVNAPFCQGQLQLRSDLRNGHLATGVLHARYDFLTKVNKFSRLGRHGYEPVLVLGTCRASKTDLIGLAYRGTVLGEVQGWLPTSGTLVRLGDRPSKLKLAGKYKAAKKIVEALKGWVQQPSVDAPPVVMNKHCPSCPSRTPASRRRRQRTT